MDMRALLEKMMKFAGGADQKQGPAGQLKGSDPMPKKGSKKHPAYHKLVGGGAQEGVEPEGNMLGELAQEAKDKSLEWRVAEAWEHFKEEAFKDTAERRPARKGSREEKVGRRGHKEIPRYKSIKEAIEGDGAEANIIVDEVVKLIGEGHTEVSPDVITTKVSAALGRPFMLKDLVAVNNNSPELQHYIDSINPTKIKFSTDILTVKNEDPMKEKQAAQDGVAKMAAKAASRPRLGESEECIDKNKITKFHKKLDTLVHSTFGKRKDEMEESAEQLNIGDDVIITGPVEHQGETGVIDSFDRDKRFVVVNLYNHGKKSFHSSDVSYNDYADSDAEEAEMYDRDPDFRDWAAKQDVAEGWGAEPAAARHREQMTAVARVLQKYKNDPVKSKIANYLFVNNWSAPAIEKELARPDVQAQYQRGMDQYERTVGPVKDWSDSMAADYLQSDQPGVDESQGDPHKILLNKLRDIERKPGVPSTDDAGRAAQAKADYAKYVAKMRKKDPNFTPLYKMDEYGAAGTPSAAGQSVGTTPATDPQKAKEISQATQTLKAATGSTAPNTSIAKAIDAASQGKSVASTDMKVLEPLMKDVATVAQNPKLAGQFKSLVQQINMAQQQQGK